MTVKTDIVRLRASTDYSSKWRSKTGRVDAIWYDYDKKTNELLAQLTVSNQQPNIKNSGTLEDINLELESMPVCQDGVKSQKTTPVKTQVIETFVDHPGFDGDRDFLRKRFRNIREHWVNHQQLIQINRDLKRFGYSRGIQDFKQKYINPRNPNQIFYCLQVGEIENG
jgi:hypothetical protein